MLRETLQKTQLFKPCSGCATLQKSTHGSTPVKHEDETTLGLISNEPPMECIYVPQSKISSFF